MRYLYPDIAYFRYLDRIYSDCDEQPSVAAAMLTLEFPALRAEEARAVFCDWRTRSRQSETHRQELPR